jgi:aspartyl aminopeptidase
MYFGMALLFHTQSVVAKSPWLLWNKIGLRLLTSTTQSLISSSLSPKATSSTQRYSTLPSISLSTVEHDRAERFLKFLDKSTDPFHAVETVSEELHKAGFHKLCEGEDWSQGNILHPGGKYFFTRQDSSLVAFTVGQQFTAGHGFKILAAHTDSPHLKIKPRSRRNSHSGVVQLNVECYGGGLWHTWFDRDLAISGRVMVRDAKNPQKVHRQLVNINRSILRIPSLCVHLRNADEREVFKFNKEEHLPPILCDHTTQLLSVNRTVTGESSWSVSQEPFLLTLLAEHLKCKEKDIADFELSIYDVQNSSRSGMMNEYICGSRLDNLASCFTIMESLIDHSVNLENDADVSMMALFDHEEVGSDSITGAGSTLVMDSIDRLSTILHRSKMDQYKELLYNAKSR